MAVSLSGISPNDTRTRAQMDELLRQEGIRRDKNLDYSCGVFDDGELIATGSSFHNTLRCLAVSSAHRGEGLMNQVVSHLLERQVEQGNLHVFLYTKVKNDRIFKDLGFYEIARVDGELVFMENRRDGFARYLRALEKTKREGRCAAVVMNANPFTLGHRCLIETAARENDCVHLFLLSEEAGPIPFAVRKRLVKEGVADLDNVILHDSGPYIISSATFPSYFLRDEDAAILAHAKLDLAVFAKIAQALGLSSRYVGEEKSSRVTALYNETMAALLPQMGLEFHEIPRLTIDGETVSASSVRQAIHDGEPERVRRFLPDTTYRFFASDEAAKINAAIRAMPDPRHY
ncbi:MAG: [citrate (pro-3S)-lyase] ligase [Oscillospiraceae bacterium]|nr:[citrate (pro-3S)-lyase] ligase [Oscillospiraceae bacterium]